MRNANVETNGFILSPQTTWNLLLRVNGDFGADADDDDDDDADDDDRLDGEIRRACAPTSNPHLITCILQTIQNQPPKQS